MHSLIRTIAFAILCIHSLIFQVFFNAALGSDFSNAISDIRKASVSYLDALSTGDPSKISSFWTPKGTFIDGADVSHLAQDLIAQEFPKDSDNNPRTSKEVTDHQSAIRMVTRDVAIEQGTTGSKQPDGSISPESKYFAIWIRTNDRWLLDYLKELSVASPHQEGPLSDLEWMVGQWVCQTETTNAHLTVSWSDQKQFLIQKFTVQLPGQEELRGEQRIAWDPSKGRIRSWLFRSDGGFVEGVWEHKSDTWVVKKTGVMPDGQTTTTVNLWVHEAPDTCWFKSFKARIGEAEVDDVILQFVKSNSSK